MDTRVVETNAHELCLLTVLGRNPEEAEYSLEKKRFRSRLAPVALFELIEVKPGLVIALCTREARLESWPVLEEAMGSRGVEAKCVEVPSGDSRDDVDGFLLAVAEAIPKGHAVIVDVTHGFRHFSFLVYLAALYVSALRGIEVRGAYYGMLRKGDVSPFLDLAALLELPQWIFALRVLETTGTTLPLALMFSDRSPSIARDLRQVSESFSSGLPLELGRRATLFLEQSIQPLRKDLFRKRKLPLASDLASRLEDVLRRYELDIPAGSGNWKTRVELTTDELRRQARVIDDLLNNDHLSSGLGLMAEWVISWTLLSLGSINAWLDYHASRKGAGRLLGALAATEKDRSLSTGLNEEQRRLGQLWRHLSSLRNSLHHHGMRPQILDTTNKQVAQDLQVVLLGWAWLREIPKVSLRPSGSLRSLLISPLGHKPGVVYSAIKAIVARDGRPPDACLILCSKETEGLVGEPLSRAGFDGKRAIIVFTDPFAGIEELDPLSLGVRSQLLSAERVYINVTGGTTLMGLAAERLGEEARDLAREVIRFGLIDRRSPAEQGEQPYEVGDALWLK